jgi:hypothetical protein
MARWTGSEGRYNEGIIDLPRMSDLHFGFEAFESSGADFCVPIYRCCVAGAKEGRGCCIVVLLIGCIHTRQLSQSPVGLGLVLGVKEKTKAARDEAENEA